MNFGKIFNDEVPPAVFDKWRTRYCRECFEDVIDHAKLGAGKAALEIGPGTGDISFRQMCIIHIVLEITDTSRVLR